METINTDTLAREFAKVLREWLTAEQMATVLERNNSGAYKDDGYSVCASHDFCDANEAMMEAFKTVTGREMFDSPEDSAERDAEMCAVNAAWDAAKTAEFWAQVTA